MIEIKRNCSSSISDRAEHHKITFGDFTIVLSYDDYGLFSDIRSELKLSPIDALQEILYAGMETLLDEIADRKQ